MADQPELEIVLPDGRPVSEYQEPQEDMGTVIDIGIGGEGGVTIAIDLPTYNMFENLHFSSFQIHRVFKIKIVLIPLIIRNTWSLLNSK